MDPDVVVAVGDVAGVRNFGWAIRHKNERRTGTGQIDDFARSVAGHLGEGRRVALGFEAPLYVPVPRAPEEIGKGRQGEGSRPFAVAAGACTLVFALQEMLYVFDVIRSHGASARNKLRVGYSLDSFCNGDIDLLVWEAFVSGSDAKAQAAELMNSSDDIGDLHAADAALKVDEFIRQFPNVENCVSPSVRINNEDRQLEPFSLAGAALLRSGLTQDVTLLQKAPLVLKFGAAHTKSARV